MKAPQASKKCGLLPSDHRIGSSTSNGIDSEQVPGTCSVLTRPPRSPQGSAQRKKRLQSGLKVLVQHRYPGRTRNQGVAHAPV